MKKIYKESLLKNHFFKEFIIEALYSAEKNIIKNAYIAKCYRYASECYGGSAKHELKKFQKIREKLRNIMVCNYYLTGREIKEIINNKFERNDINTISINTLEEIEQILDLKNYEIIDREKHKAMQ